MGRHARPSLLAPLRDALVNVHRLPPVHNLYDPVGPLITGLNDHQCPTPSNALVIRLGFGRGDPEVGQGVHNIRAALGRNPFANRGIRTAASCII
jgi:hypothetical protein